jgi:AcrR family transcriptional regulator
MGRPKEVSDQAIVAAARRIFLERGAGVSAVEIGRALGVSHTTVFNRFGSKEALMIASLGPPEGIPWIAAIKDGPDLRPIREQLVYHAKVIASYFLDVHAGLSVLQSAGIPKDHIFKAEASRPAEAYAALSAWLEKAQKQKRLAKCDIPTLARMILSALQGWAFTAQVCGGPTSPKEYDLHIERFIALLWDGIQPVPNERSVSRAETWVREPVAVARRERGGVASVRKVKR